jgi:hypothetical protein
MVLYQRPEGLSSDQYGIAPFDASKEVKKLASWDLPPMEADMEEIHFRVLNSWHFSYNSLTPAASSFQTVDIFWLGRFFSSI